MDDQADWTRKTAGWLAGRFRVDFDDAVQELHLWLIRTSGNRKFSRLKAIRWASRQGSAWQGAVVERAAPPDPGDAETLAAEVLDERQWLVVQLHVQHAMTFKAIGKQLGIGPRCVSAIYQRAISILREEMQ